MAYLFLLLLLSKMRSSLRSSRPLRLTQSKNQLMEVMHCGWYYACRADGHLGTDALSSGEESETDDLDLCFLCDCTGSMGCYISVAQRNIVAIATRLTQTGRHNLRFSLVCYRDHQPEEMSYAVRVFGFTDSLEQMQSHVHTMSAKGGGDTPESVACALQGALDLQWRPNATLKMCVCISDAPPHGLGFTADRWPDGCPCGCDPIAVAHSMKAAGIVLYTVGCEPEISRTAGTKEFFKGLADITGGRYLSLVNAELLPDIIVGGAEEEAALRKLEAAVAAEAAAIRQQMPHAGGCEDEEAIYSMASASVMSKKNIAVPQFNMSQQADIPHSSLVESAQSLAGAKVHTCSLPHLSSEFCSLMPSSPPPCLLFAP
jgi:Mg-chelatase subunit ChlD